jgi:site-specific recombinase XerC
VNNLLNDYTNYLATRGLSRGTIHNYTADLSRFIRWFETATAESFSPEKLRPYHLDHYRIYLEEQHVPDAAARRYLASQRTFLRWIDPLGKLFHLTPEVTPTQTARFVAQPISGEDPLGAYATYLATQRLSTSVIDEYIAALGQFIRWIEVRRGRSFVPKDLDVRSIDTFKAYLIWNGTSERAITSTLAGLKHYFRWVNPAVDIPADIPVPVEPVAFMKTAVPAVLRRSGNRARVSTAALFFLLTILISSVFMGVKRYAGTVQEKRVTEDLAVNSAKENVNVLASETEREFWKYILVLAYQPRHLFPGCFLRKEVSNQQQ